MRLFLKDDDFLAFERIIEKTLLTRPMRILAYCVLPDHWHIDRRQLSFLFSDNYLSPPRLLDPELRNHPTTAATIIFPHPEPASRSAEGARLPARSRGGGTPPPAPTRPPRATLPNPPPAPAPPKNPPAQIFAAGAPVC